MARPEESNVSENIKHGTMSALAIIPKSFDEARQMAAVYAKSSLLPQDLRGKEADVFVTIMAGQELGLPPMASLRGIHVVKGKPVLSADAMVAVALRSGQCEYFRCIDESNIVATYETKRVGSPKPQTMSWSIEDARAAGLAGGDNWKRYPRAMLKARCKAALARDVYPDVLAGVYDEDEAREFGDRPQASPAEYIDAEVVAERKHEPPAKAQPVDTTSEVDALVADVAAAQTIVALNALAPRANKLKKGSPDYTRVRTAWAARKAAIEQAERDRLAEDDGRMGDDSDDAIDAEGVES
jgi:hypothetical protein